MNGFEEKFRMSWRQIEKDNAREFLENLIDRLRDYSSFKEA